jgi:anti-sigma28 factor (negative regulator of flagellin synthesis)
MPASKKKTSTKKGSAKKATSKKSAAKKVPTASLAGDRLKLNFPLDGGKVAAIKRCLAKGKLTVTVNKVDLGAGRIGEAWIYD